MGVNRAVDVPAAVSEWFAAGGPVRVPGLVDDLGIRATLAPRGGGVHRLFLNGVTR